MKKYKETYYQPICGDNLPETLFSFQVFYSKEDCVLWLTENGYDAKYFEIQEYHDEDIEEHTYIPSYYYPIDRKGRIILPGDTVIWTDPEKGYTARYIVFGEPDAEIVKLHSEYGECEALPQECKVLITKRKKKTK